MRIAKTGREYAKWAVNAPEGVGLDVTFDRGVTWHLMERPADGLAQVLIAGPFAPSNPVGTIVLAEGRNEAAIRLTDNPEIVVRTAGAIIVYDI